MQVTQTPEKVFSSEAPRHVSRHDVDEMRPPSPYGRDCLLVTSDPLVPFNYAL